MTRVSIIRARTRLWLQRLEARDLPAFLTAPSYTVESSSNATAIADFNGDGAGDVAVAHAQASGKISVLIADGNGFEPPVLYPASSNTRDVIAADFSGDGIIDLVAVGSTSSNNLSVFRGNGDGTFEPAQMYKASAVGSTALVADDFNNDGALDVATITIASTVTIVLNNLTGGFGEPTGFVATTTLYDLQSGDLNGDGNADVLAVGYYCESGPWKLCHPKIHVYLGNGAGSLASGPIYEDSNPSSVVLADFDLDNDLDFVTVSSGTYSTHDIRVWLGNGDGTFAFDNAYKPVDIGGVLTAGDLNGDGNIDLIASNSDAKTVTVLKGSGDGRFQLDLGYALQGTPNAFAVGDLNGDLDLDVAATYGASQFTVLRNQSGGKFQGVAIYPLDEYPYSAANADFNGDGKPDLAVSEGNGGIDYVNVLMGLGDGTFGPAGRYAVGNTPNAIAVGDFNLDGHRDLVTADRYSNQVSVLRNKGDGTFFPASKFAAGTEPLGVVVADFNGDGAQDLVVTNGYAGTVSFLRGTGTGRFRAPVSYPALYFPTAITHGDFDGDGKLDLAVTATANLGNYSKVVLILRGNGNGSFTPVSSHLLPTTWIYNSILTKDFNGDGNLDLATAWEHPDSSQQPSVFILLGNGDNTFQDPVGYVVFNNCSSLAAADFDGDGTLDLAVGIGNTFANTLALLRGNGDGSFTQPIWNPANDYYPVGPYVQSLTAGDFNGDGSPDLAAALGAYSGFPGVSIILNANDRSKHAGRPLPPREGIEGTPFAADDSHRIGSISQPRVGPGQLMPHHAQAEVNTPEELNLAFSLRGARTSRLNAIKRLSDDPLASSADLQESLEIKVSPPLADDTFSKGMN